MLTFEGARSIAVLDRGRLRFKATVCARKLGKEEARLCDFSEGSFGGGQEVVFGLALQRAGIHVGVLEQEGSGLALRAD
ncbi:hypothetical protein ANAPC5_01360 [Anaplasma phagocytophilum]|nr:hypothetical protein ANAPC5_01360 [Anaplasma phagocytophilum]